MTREPKVVRAAFDDRAVIVYQAYSPVIAEEAIRLQTFGPAFSLGRMTWIKPSFGWMLYRSGQPQRHMSRVNREDAKNAKTASVDFVSRRSCAG